MVMMTLSVEMVIQYPETAIQYMETVVLCIATDTPCAGMVMRNIEVGKDEPISAHRK